MSVLQDLRFGARMLRRNPGFTAVAVLALGLGIGVNSTVFTLVNAVLIRGLPFRDSHRIMHLSGRNLARGDQPVGVSYPDYLDWREQTWTFEGLAACTTGTMNVSDSSGVPERMSGAWMTADAFRLLGQAPRLGRDFLPEEDRSGAAPVALIGYGMWQTRYGGDPQAVGRVLKVNDVHHTIVGVMPEGMKFPFNADMWLPLVKTPAMERRGERDLEVFGRLRPDASLEKAQTELSTICARLEQTYPDTNKGIKPVVIGYNDHHNGGPIRIVFLVLMGAVGFVLLIACGNVANLLLSRAAARAREFSVRAALGAGRRRLVQQTLVESLLLSSLGGLLGLGLSFAGVRMFAAAVADVGKPYWIVFSMDYRVVAFFIAVCLLTAVLFGLAPALQMSRVEISEALKEGGRGSSAGVRSRRLTASLVVTQLSLTLILLVGAGLMIRSFLKVQSIDVGVETKNLLTLRVVLPENKYGEKESRIEFQDRLSQRLRSVPGIGATAVASNIPLSGAFRRPLEIAGTPAAERDKLPQVDVLVVGPGYFEALGVDLLRGRGFRETDGRPGSEAVIVNEKFAARRWPDEDPLGKQIRLGEEPGSPWLQVIGVSPAIRQNNPTELEISSTAYVPYRQEPLRFFSILARGTIPAETLTSAIRAEVQDVDPDLPVYNIATLEQALARASWPFRVFGSLFAVFAGIALALSVVGVYAVTSYSVSQRTQEIGVRMALGAQSRDLIWLVGRQALRPLSIGLLLGLLGAFGVSRVMAGLLVQISPSDPVTFASISAILVLAYLSACVVPARRAALLDPVEALRE